MEAPLPLSVRRLVSPGEALDAAVGAGAVAAAVAAAASRPMVPPLATTAARWMAIAQLLISAGESAHRNTEALGVSTCRQLLRFTFGCCGKMHADA